MKSLMARKTSVCILLPVLILAIVWGAGIIGLSMSIADKAIAATTSFYITPGGAGTKDGSSWTNAYAGFPMISSGKWSLFGAGTTIYLAGGTYNQDLAIGASGSSASPLTIKKAINSDHGSDAGWQSSYDSQVVVSVGKRILLSDYDYVTIDGATNDPYYGIKVSVADSGSPDSDSFGILGTLTDGKDNKTVILKNIEVAGPGVDKKGENRGLQFYYGTDMLIDHCYFHDSVAALYLGGDRATVQNSLFKNIYGPYPLHPDTWYVLGGSNQVFRWNTVIKTTAETIFMSWGGINMKIYGNVFVRAPQAVLGYNGDGGGDNAEVYGNTFVDCATAGVRIMSGVTGWTVKNNLFYNSDAYADGYDGLGCSGCVSSNNLAVSSGATSIFQDYSNDNYHLKSTAGSAIINAGANLGSPYNIDLDGNTHSASGAWDIGAYEYIGGVVVTPPADTTSPAIPAGLTSPVKTDTTINLSWSTNGETDLAGYKLYRNGTLLTSRTTTSYQVTGLTANTTYQFQLSSYDTIGNESAKTSALSVTTNTATPLVDTTNPTVSIVYPTSVASYATTSASILLTGTASDNVGISSVTLTNNGQSVSVNGTANWSASLSLTNGNNSIVVTAYDVAGNSQNKSLTVSYTYVDNVPPVIHINVPSFSQTPSFWSRISKFFASAFLALTGRSSTTTYSSLTSNLSLSGTASDNIQVTSITWGNNLGGEGTAIGTSTWNIPNIVLQPGTNQITITAFDGANNQTKSVIAVSYAGTTTPNATSTNIIPGLVLSYDFNEGQGTVVSDASTGSHQATISGARWTNSGKFGGALSFNGTNSYVKINDNDILDSLTQGTITAWVKPVFSDNGYRAWFSADSGKCLSPLELVVNNGRFEVYAARSGCRANFNASVAISNPTAWHHLAYVVSDSGNKFYVDGKEVPATYRRGSTTSKFFFAATASRTTKYNIGKTMSDPTEVFYGTIDNVRVYNKALNIDEIKVDMNTPGFFQ